MDAELRGEVRDWLALPVVLNERHLLIVSQLPSLPGQIPPPIRTPTRSRCRQSTEVGGLPDLFEYH
ncbi:hypothetical protein RM52_01010 [Microbacterium hominis]|uniref:Uncharacterized protein n=1 Tax=Microbacterium hominis TaxID=162426 RepID=A0A0B4D760_9MICO|nr:hypothetical protein RM52_01010 [Microbacterium hominis]